MDIKPVNAKHLLQMACQKDHKGYIWILCVLSLDCTSKECTRIFNHMAKWCVNTAGKVAHKDYDKFMSAKPEYTKKALMKQVSKKYYSIIEVFMKSNANKVAEYQAKWDHEIHLEKSKKTPFVQNYKPLLDQKTSAMKKYIDKHLEKSFI